MARVPNQGSSASPVKPTAPRTGKPGTSQGGGGKLQTPIHPGGIGGTGKGAH